MANTPATPRTWVAANVLTAAQLNVDVRDNTDYILTSKPNCRVYNSASISLATSGTAQAITFDSERFDKGSGMHSTSSNTSRLTVPTSCGGVYAIGGNLEIASNATGKRIIAIRLNGATYIAQDSRAAISGAATDLSISTLYALAAGDYVELMGYQDSGGALNTVASANFAPEFWAYWVST